MAQRGVQSQQSGSTQSRDNNNNNNNNNNKAPDHQKSKTSSSSSSSSSLFRVLQDRFKPNPDESETSMFRTNPAVNRPQVLTPSSFESDRMQRLKERKDCAFHWTNPHSSHAATTLPPPLPNAAASAAQHPTFLTAFRAPSGIPTTFPKRRESIHVIPGPGKRISVANGKSETGCRRASVDVSSLNSLGGGREGLKAGCGGVDRTPMSSLMRAEVELTAGKKTEPSKLNAKFGVSEFLELYRSRAYSDPRLLDARRAAAASSKLGFSGSRRRRTQSSCMPILPESLGVDTPILSRHHVIVWKDKASTRVIKLPVSVEFHETLQETIADDENAIYAQLMSMHCCSELMPHSSKVVLLDARVKVVTAFHALTLHAINSAPLWDPESMQFVGLLTVTDFIRILQLYRNSPEALNELEDEKILSWKDRLKASRRLVYVCADDSISDAVRTLDARRIHRLPVFDESKDSILYFLSYRRILQFIRLFMNSLPRPQFMNLSIRELNVGTFESIASIGVDRPLYEAFDLLIGRSVSALPVVDDGGRVVAVYARADAVSLANDRSYRNLNTTVGKALSADRESVEGVYLCKKTDSLSQVVEWIVRTKVHRLIVADDDHRCEGIVSVSDVVRFLVLNPPKKIVEEKKEEDVRGVTEDEKGDVIF